MDFEAIAELVLLAMVGLSILTVSFGLTVRVFLGPVLRDMADRLAKGRSQAGQNQAARLDQIEERLTAIENGVYRLQVVSTFDRELAESAEGPKDDG